MNGKRRGGIDSTRRGFLTTVGLAALAVPAGARAATEAPAADAKPVAPQISETEPFWGAHQAGIVTPPQRHTYFAALDIVTDKRDELVRVMKAWTAAAARLTAGLPIEPFQQAEIDYGADNEATTVTSSTDPKPTVTEMPDTGEAHGLATGRLTLTFGFGPGLFVKDGKDRFGLATHRPEALAELPRFTGDQLVEAQTGGDLSVQGCADDPQVAFHAVRQLARLAQDVAQVRWAQTGFMPSAADKGTPRNLMGFKDGTNNPRAGDPQAMAEFIWVGDEGPDWLRGGSYLVARRIRIALEHWDRTKIAFQEATVGRHKDSGAPLGGKAETDALDLTATGKDGNPVIGENAHVRLAAAASNAGAQILRRPYSYNDGVNFTAERWPPWRQGMEYDAGLFFLAYQRDPRTGFIKIYDRMAKVDMMNQFVTHVGGGLFACPGGVSPNEYIGQKLFGAA